MQSLDRQDLPGTALLQLARSSIEYGLVHKEPLPIRIGEWPPELTEPGATFTTLRLAGQLRGCCGTLVAELPLARDVAYSAFRAAFRDSRFDPVGNHELDAIQLAVSVLTPLEPMSVKDETDLLGRLTPGTDGLVIFADGLRATLLPTVWKTLPEPRQFLAALKLKCGLKADYWSDRLEFHRYQTTTYAEPAQSNSST